MKTVVLKLLLALVAFVAAAVLMEGAWSLIGDESAIRRGADWLLGADTSPRADRVSMLDEERIAAAALTEGPYALEADPAIGFRMKAGVTRLILNAPATMDSWGQRVRPGPEPEPGAPRVVVLGDSVAFGFGVGDDETFAHQLEELLAGARVPGAPRPSVHTVACPGWNMRGVCRYLKDHLARLRPDVVILMPVRNDLHDNFTLNEVGHRSPEFDPAYGLARPHVSLETYALLGYRMIDRAPPELLKEFAGVDVLEGATHVVNSDVTPESRRLWDELVTDVRDVRSRLAARGARLAAAFLWPLPWEDYCEYRLLEAMPDLPVIPLLRELRSKDTLKGDPHPTPRCIGAGAWLMADFLLENDWVPGTSRERLAPLDPDYTSRRRRVEPAPIRRSRGESRRKLWRRFIGPEIDLTTARGFHQIYGGVHFSDEMVGTSLFAGLANPARARTLELRVERLPRSSGVYPVALEAAVNGVSAGSAELPPPEDPEVREMTLTFTVPETVRGAPYLDALIRSSNWVTRRSDGISRVACYRLLGLRLR